MALKINLDIEALLDVRYGWLCRQDASMRDEILFNFNPYCDRDHDNFWLMFPSITEKMCKDRKRYTTEDLKLAVRTNVFNLIDDAIASTNQSLHTHEDVIITINLRHYEIDESGIEALKVLTSARFEHEVVVEIMRRPFGKMTPKFLDDNFDLNIYYDFVGWLNMYWTGLVKLPSPGIVFYAPVRFPDKVEGLRNFNRLMLQANLDGPNLEVISDMLGPYIRIYFTDSKYYAPIASR